jgi:hypothetical protein
LDHWSCRLFFRVVNALRDLLGEAAGRSSAAGNRTFTQDVNSDGSLTLNSPGTATYTVDSTGRVLLTTNSGVNDVFYLLSANQAVGLDIDSGNTQPVPMVRNAVTFTSAALPTSRRPRKVENGVHGSGVENTGR